MWLLVGVGIGIGNDEVCCLSCTRMQLCKLCAKMAYVIHEGWGWGWGFVKSVFIFISILVIVNASVLNDNWNYRL